ncbi:MULTISPECIES: acyl carrier protein [Streptomyces]|uniref:Phosphopantetheine-binding protein n=1 Tax=Streptomyces glycanivorans TaxID=3033808 RepID=A0ABY9JKL0_9ACTN|nr:MULTISPECIES: phosphopantetheine-binding protein [unclassified Streptomyces]WSQ81598.1 phosphopantetheine-binding protein [Streptomyces sp. NBC_01213]TXS07990.1 acyl carrier protein [Streptomyces sp. wa22]WLQ68242.1 phosphopantetheine-binding protein [Streptomyces sp. Alt3]WSQ88923.1 phosphopantetheine-binding protein [Streptomyces sp. NBC_01212]WSR05071.1 phosphopantetheine-binding protein [Streptomyces sp. NBC_01208]
MSDAENSTEISTEFTLEKLLPILLEGAGADDRVDLGGDILDAEFTALGYESLAMLETAGRIEREYEISLDETALAEAVTPRALIELVNTHLPAARTA